MPRVGAAGAGDSTGSGILTPYADVLRTPRYADSVGQRRVLVPIVLVHLVGGLCSCSRYAARVVTGGLAALGRLRDRRRRRRRAATDLEHDPDPVELPAARPPRLNTALAFESVVDELVFIIGPVLVTFLSTTGHTTSGLVTAFALAVVGSLLFAAQVETEPPPSGHHPRRGPSALRRPACSCSARSAPRWGWSSARSRWVWSRSPTRLTRRPWPVCSSPP